MVVPALVAIRAVWWRQTGRFLLKHQLNRLGIFAAGNDFDLTTAVFTDRNIDVDDAFESLGNPLRSWLVGAARGSCHPRRYRVIQSCLACCHAWPASLEHGA